MRSRRHEPREPREAGRAGEARAAAFLAAQGYQLRARNWHCRYGEWDLIFAAPGDRLWAFVEVRYRRHPLGGHTAATVTPTKQRRLTLAAQFYLAAATPEHGERFARTSAACVAKDFAAFLAED